MNLLTYYEYIKGIYTKIAALHFGVFIVYSVVNNYYTANNPKDPWKTNQAQKSKYK